MKFGICNGSGWTFWNAMVWRSCCTSTRYQTPIPPSSNSSEVVNFGSIGAKHYAKDSPGGTTMVNRYDYATCTLGSNIAVSTSITDIQGNKRTGRNNANGFWQEKKVRVKEMAWPGDTFGHHFDERSTRYSRFRSGHDMVPLLMATSFR